jgi:hypothetical protein
MSVASSDIKIRYSVGTGSAGLTTAGVRDAAFGKYVSTTDVTAPPNSFWDDVSSAEALSGDTEYRCVFIYNSHSTDSALNVTVSITGEVALGGTTTIALDNVATGAANGAGALSAIIANENTAPTPVGSFSTGPLSIGTLAAGQAKAVWLKRVVGASTAAIVGDGFTFNVGGDG